MELNIVTKDVKIEDLWTADFTKFRQKVEPLFGPFEDLAIRAPDIYAHQVLAHGFVEYAGLKNIYGKAKTEVAGSEDKFHKIIRGPESEQRTTLREQYNQQLKKEYMEWAKGNNLPENLLEAGWQCFLDD